MSLREYLTAVRKYWFAIAALALIGGIAAYGLSLTRPMQYRSSTGILVTSEVGGSATDLLQGSTYVENLVASYVRLTTSERVLRPVIDELALDTTPRGLANSISAESPVNTVLINIHVTGGDPQEVARLANAVTNSLAKTVSEVSPTTQGGKPAIRLSVVESASASNVPVAPDKKKWAAVGLMAGLILGVVFALLRRTFGSAIAESSDVARVTDAPVVGEIIEAQRGTTLPAAVLGDREGVQAESLRGLTANLNFLGVGEGLRSLVVTSASPAESKSSIATSTAIVLAEASHKVLLIDADLRAPTVHRLAGLDNSIGLSTVLIGEDSMEETCQRWGHPGLHVLTSGPLAPNPSQLLNSDAMRGLVEGAWHSYDYVIIDSAPLLSVTDAVWLGHMTDGVIVVVRRGKTKPQALARALDILDSSRTAVAGIVISRVPRRSKGYGYGYDSPGSRSRHSRRQNRSRQVRAS